MKKTIIVLILLLTFPFFAYGEPNDRWDPDDWNDEIYQLVIDYHVEIDPVCNVCGSTRELGVHQIIPLFDDPSRLFDHSNYVTLCSSKKWGIYCGWVAGYGCLSDHVNPWVLEDIKVLRKIADPEYVKKHGKSELNVYLGKMRTRIRKYNREHYPNREFKEILKGVVVMKEKVVPEKFNPNE